jgi:hypothetical protein
MAGRKVGIFALVALAALAISACTGPGDPTSGGVVKAALIGAGAGAAAGAIAGGGVGAAVGAGVGAAVGFAASSAQAPKQQPALSALGHPYMMANPFR